jgi:hypothetical protein
MARVLYDTASAYAEIARMGRAKETTLTRVDGIVGAHGILVDADVHAVVGGVRVPLYEVEAVPKRSRQQCHASIPEPLPWDPSYAFPCLRRKGHEGRHLWGHQTAIL